MANKAPGKHFRKGISIPEFFKMFPSNEVAEQWFIERRWPSGICCPYLRLPERQHGDQA